MLVQFKKHLDGDIIAFFPETTQNGELLSYEHIGQHSNASIAYYNELPDATQEEYAPLLAELVDLVGYDDLVVGGPFNIGDEIENYGMNGCIIHIYDAGKKIVVYFKETGEEIQFDLDELSK